MRANIADYNAVVEAASKFTRSVAEGSPAPAQDRRRMEVRRQGVQPELKHD